MCFGNDQGFRIKDTGWRVCPHVTSQSFSIVTYRTCCVLVVFVWCFGYGPEFGIKDTGWAWRAYMGSVHLRRTLRIQRLMCSSPNSTAAVYQANN